MKRLLFCLILVSCFLNLASFSEAINPVIIKKAKPGAPPPDTKLSDDSIYYPNDFGLVCSGTYTISQTFEPRETSTTDPTTGEVTTSYEPYDVNQITDMSPIFNKTFWTNPAALNFFAHMNSTVKALVGDPAATRRAFTTYDPYSTYGSFGAESRSLPWRSQACLKGQRLVKAVQVANGSLVSEVSNEQVAWDNGGSYAPVTDTGQNTGKKVQLDDIALSLDEAGGSLSLSQTDDSGRPIPVTTPEYPFYDPNADCLTNNPERIPTPGPLSSFPNTGASDSFQSIPPEDAIQLYKTLSAVGGGPSARQITLSSDDHGAAIDIVKKITNMPRGETFATRPSVAYFIKPQSQAIKPIDICIRYDKDTIMDKPNPVNGIPRIAIEDFGQVFEKAVAFSFNLPYKYSYQPSVAEGMAADYTAFTDPLPQSVIDNSCISRTDMGYSSTDGFSFDIGNNCVRKEFTQNILPAKRL